LGGLSRNALRLYPFSVPWEQACLFNVRKPDDLLGKALAAYGETAVRRAAVLEKVEVAFKISTKLLKFGNLNVFGAASGSFLFY
jgi:hypothetical protein